MTTVRIAPLGVSVVLALALGAGAFACSSSSSGTKVTTGTDAGGGDSGPSVAPGQYLVETACTDQPGDVYKDPGPLPGTKGAILKCAKYMDIAQADLLTTAQANTGYVGPAFTSGAHVYRVLYETERGNSTPGYSSALVFIPDTPRGPQMPVIVASHGSRGQAAKCAPSMDDPAGAYVEPDFQHQVYPLVGAGYVVIAPDLAGYANYGAAGNPPSAYADAQDVGKSTLDGARALKKLLSTSVSDKVVIVGHSQGGGTALAGVGVAPTYAPELNIVGAAVYSPLWLPGRTTGAFLEGEKLTPGSYPMATSSIPKVILWTLYTSAELYDGQGQGAAILNAASAAGVKSFVDNDCWAADYPDLDALGADANAVMDPNFISSIGEVSAGIGQCNAGDAVCQKWIARFDSIRPNVGVNHVPILELYGAMDQTITPDLAACVFEKYKQDGANYKVCLDPTAGHSSVVSNQAAYVNSWIAGVALGAAAPADCAENESNLVNGSGQPIACNASVEPINKY